MKKLLLILCAFLVISACGKNKDPDPPAQLVDVKAKLNVDKLWSEGLGGKAKRLRLALQPQIVEGVVFAASHNGDVVAIDEQSGKNRWRVKTKRPLSAGPGVGTGMLAVGSSDGDIILLDANSGTQVWSRKVTSEVLAAPVITEDSVIVRLVDGRLQALDLKDGKERWTTEQTVPRLSLRGTAAPIRAGDLVIAGFDNGRVMAVDLRAGTTLWDTLVSAPRGRTELERLADIDAPAKVAGDDVFVVGFQGRAAMLAKDSGQIWWARDLSSYRGFDMDDQNIYVTNGDSVVVAIRKRDGAPVWEFSGLRKRGLTAPVIDADSLVVADYEGYVHWLDKATGEVIARAKTDGDRISNAPVSADGRVFVMTDSGDLLAFKSAPKG